ncbi:hypothetical protein C8039_13240 [Halogeometricum sp. wsp3]|nr:hypothetical protein C8039_13240 [Halogeometricum sp. wsp3]
MISVARYRRTVCEKSSGVCLAVSETVSCAARTSSNESWSAHSLRQTDTGSESLGRLGNRRYAVECAIQIARSVTRGERTRLT